MSLENIQVYRNFTNWRVCTITLPDGEFKSINDLLSEDDREALGDRPVVCVDFSFESDTQTVDMSHAEDAGASGVVTLIAGIGPGRWVGPPIINAHKKIFLRRGSAPSTFKVLLYTA